MVNLHQKFFLGTNSAEGFVSHFLDSYTPGDWHAFIIKGGPGSGKSSFMKYIAAQAENKGYLPVLCPCSSDPDSLDGVVIEDIKTVILDGTAPHIVEPKFPGACENIINLGQFWDSKNLFENAEKIIDTSKRNSTLHKTASAYLSAAGELILDNLKLSRLFLDRTATLKFARRLVTKYLPERDNKNSYEFFRFIGGTTPKGIVGYSRTITDFYKRIVLIEDKYGSASGEIMKYIRAAAKQRGYGVITIKNPFLPSELIDHILIPELSLAFVTENEFIKFDTDLRRIHSRRFTDNRALKDYRARMLFNRRVSRELLTGAVLTLKKAKEVHDQLESHYINAMDFAALTEFSKDFAEKIL